MSDPFLRAFLQQCSDHAEGLFKPDRPADEFMLAHIIAEALNGEISLFVCPMQGDDELMFRVGVPLMLRGRRTFRHWCFFSEAWTAERTVGKPAPMPRNDPARVEIVAFAAENAAGEVLLAERQIYRAPGQPARLLPLVFPTMPKAFVMETATR